MAPFAEQTIRALLIEDDLSFATMIGEWLEDVERQHSSILPYHIFLTRVSELAHAFEELKRSSFDILLIDLNLPDSMGLETFERIRHYTASFPVIVLSGLDDESQAIQAVRNGAQDYLVKNTIDGNLLFRSIGYAMERHALKLALEQVRESERRARELGSLDRLSERSLSRIAAEMLGIRELKRDYQDIFQRLVARFGVVLDQQIQMRTHKVTYNISDELKQLAAELGFLRCGPRDVVDLYLTTLEQREVPGYPQRNEAIHEECRYLAFELMGRLVSFYRPYAMGGDG
ncbi:MAG: response regulator [Magnetococcales bacterium]|nr:response regulator [Magnetococcales bacterium]